MSRSGKSMDVLTDLLAAVLLSLSIAGNAWAQATKAATASSDLFIVTGPGGTFTTPFSTILSTSIKPPQGSKDLLITVSAATTLLTVDTRSLSTGGAASIDDVGIDVQVLVDGAPVVVGHCGPLRQLNATPTSTVPGAVILIGQERSTARQLSSWLGLQFCSRRGADLPSNSTLGLCGRVEGDNHGDFGASRATDAASRDILEPCCDRETERQE